jgi:hypothetical protein
VLIFLKILFFGATIQLNQNPITVNDQGFTFSPTKNLNVVTTGAHLKIDTANDIKASEIFEARELSAKKYPAGCVTAKFLATDNTIYNFQNTGILLSKDNTMITLSAIDKLNTELEFKKVTIKSCNPINNTNITWSNYKH